MDELLAGALAAIAEVLIEVVFEIAGEAFASLLTRASSRLFKTVSDLSPVALTLAIGMFGAMVGFLSVAVYPHQLVHPSRFHGVSVIVSPLLTGLVMSKWGSLLRNLGKKAVPVESFGYGFAFAFAMALVRFLMLR